MNKQIMKTLALASICIFTHQASAYTTWTCLGEKMKWSSNSAHMRLSAVSFANSSWRNSMLGAITRTNENPSRFRFTSGTGDTSLGIDNGQNETWFSSDQNLLGGAPAVAISQRDCIDYWIFGKDVEITEVDVLFSSGTSYSTTSSKASLTPYGGSFRPFQTTAIHELGHGAGLAHTNNTYNIMGQDWDHIHANGNTARAYLGEDAASGLVYLYGSQSAGAQDLSISHFKRTGASGQYSAHGKTVLRTTTGGAVSSFTNAGEQTFRVNRGQTYRVELTFENNGRSFFNQDLRFYISTNNLISTFDRLVRTTSVSLSRNTVYTAYYNVTIPSDLVRGANYWVGAVIDADGTVVEMSESNNATYLPIRIN